MNRSAIAILASLGAAVASAQRPSLGETTPNGGQAPHQRQRLFVSPMGEPVRSGEAPETQWFAAADSNHDGRLSRAEFIADAVRFFATLDQDHSGSIGPAEIERYERDVVPEIGGMSGGPLPDRGEPGPPGGRQGGGHHAGGMRGDRPNGGGNRRPGSSGEDPDYTYRASGAGRFGYIATPEPVTAADTDLNGSVTEKELVEAAGRRFALLDANGDGSIDPKELPKLPTPRSSRYAKR